LKFLVCVYIYHNINVPLNQLYKVESEGFWRWYILVTLRITRFLDFVHSMVLKKHRTQSFGNWIW
jgi:hypothetical protein